MEEESKSSKDIIDEQSKGVKRAFFDYLRAACFEEMKQVTEDISFAKQRGFDYSLNNDVDSIAGYNRTVGEVFVLKRFKDRIEHIQNTFYDSLFKEE
jgi:hypothetical protein